MKPSIFMRVLLCKIHCPSFICFCKPSSAAHHLYNPGPLKLENTPHVPSTVVLSVAADSSTSDQLSVGEAPEVNEASPDGNQQPENVLKSCIRKGYTDTTGAGKEVEKKKVQWMDSTGKELVDIKEFESSDTGDTDSENENRGCVCIIL